MMRLSKSIGACLAAMTTLGLAAAISTGSASALPPTPPGASPPAFPTVELNAEPVGVAVDPGNHLAYVTNPLGDGDGEVSVIDAATLGPPGSLTAPSAPPVLLEQLAVGGNPRYVGVDTSTHIAYVSDDNGLTPINGATDPPTLGATIPAALVQPGPVAVDSTTHTVHVVDANSPDIKVVDAAANSPTATTLETAETPTGIAVDPTTHLVYVTEQADDLLQVIAGADNPPQVIHTIHLGDPAYGTNPGAQPDAVAVDPITHTIYVTNYNPGTVQVINGYEITAGIKAPSYPFNALTAVAVDPTAHTAYLANGTDTTVSVVGPPSIITPSPAGSLPEGPLGLAYSTSMQVFGGGSPYSWSATGLPAGLAINRTTGVISGYPIAVGTSQVTVSVSALLGSASKRFSLTIELPPKTNPCKTGTCT